MLSARRLLVTACLLVAAAPSWAPALADTLVLTPVAVSRQNAPVGGRYVLFGSVNIDSVRRVTFTASLSRGKVGIFRTEHGTVTPLLLTGDPAPPSAGTAFDTLLEAASNARGDMAFVSTIFFPQRIGVFLMRDGAITTLALEGDPAPTRRGEYFADFGQVRILESGDVYFTAALSDTPFSPVTTGLSIVRATASGLEGLVAPGDRGVGDREVVSTLQFHVNESGAVTTTAVITSPSSLAPASVVEVDSWVDGVLTPLASENLSVSGGVDAFRNFAVTFDQVRVLPSGESVFYAGTNDFMNGAYFIHDGPSLFDNRRLIAQRDRSPVSPNDRFAAFGGFGTNQAGDLVFHATTNQLPAGGMFFRRGITTIPVAKAGDARPDGLDVWHGFLMVEMNEAGAFVFTDFQDQFVQVAVYTGRLVPPASILIDQISDAIRSGGLDRSVSLGLLAELRAIGRAAERNGAGALRLAEALRREVQSRSGHSIPAVFVDHVDPMLEDLVIALGGPSTAPHGRPTGPRLVLE